MSKNKTTAQKCHISSKKHFEKLKLIFFFSIILEIYNCVEINEVKENLKTIMVFVDFQ